ncbi:MAG TPA: sugar phosphate isomerase/epimerase family protein [Planctomycetota bacterium]|jgi:sugar phosphate isomerase/epimerase
MSIVIGNQTAFSAPEALTPFEFACANNFDAFEWFSDKKDTGAGWGEDDFSDEQCAAMAQLARAHGIRYSVHAPWQATPLTLAGRQVLLKSIAFAKKIRARVVNFHLSVEQPLSAFAKGLAEVLPNAAENGVQLTIENTTKTTASDANDLFRLLADVHFGNHAGFCLDIGHANLCPASPQGYLQYARALSPAVPIQHLHFHENNRDADSHLTLFTGPAGQDDTALRSLLRLLHERNYDGSIILEQWPKPPTLLVQARTRLLELLAQV